MSTINFRSRSADRQRIHALETASTSRFECHSGKAPRARKFALGSLGPPAPDVPVARSLSTRLAGPGPTHKTRDEKAETRVERAKSRVEEAGFAKNPRSKGRQPALNRPISLWPIGFQIELQNHRGPARPSDGALAPSMSAVSTKRGASAADCLAAQNLDHSGGPDGPRRNVSGAVLAAFACRAKADHGFDNDDSSG